MTRWTVRKERTMFWDEDDEWRYDHRWHVTSPTGVSWGNYETHAEALAYADQQARTREYVLPRPSLIQIATIAPAKEGDKPAFVFPHTPKGVAVVASGPFFIPYDQCGLIGLALLALAEKENNE